VKKFRCVEELSKIMASYKIQYSIITASYNEADKIESTLKSAFEYNDTSLFEYIVVDGGSTDGTIDILSKYCGQYPANFRFISEADKGIYDALNKGIDLADGEYLYFIGAGDVLVRNVLSHVKKELNHSPEIVYGNVIWGPNGFIVGGGLQAHEICHSFISHQAIFYHNVVFSLLGKYDANYKVIADNYLNLLAFAHKKITQRYVPIEIAIYEYGGVSARTCDPKYASDIVIAIRKGFGEDGIKRYECCGRRFYDIVRNSESIKVLIIGNDEIIFDVLDAVRFISAQFGNNIKIEGIVSNNKKMIGVQYEGSEVTEVESTAFHKVDKVICASFGEAFSDLRDELSKNGVLKDNIIAGGLATVWSYSLYEFLEKNNGCEIAIFGTGVLGQTVYKLIQYYNRNYGKNFNICCFFDNNKDKCGEKIESVEIRSPNIIGSEKIDQYVIASMAKIEIRSQLIKLGVNQASIINGGPPY